MKTEFLKGLGLDQEAIDQIMAENGKDVNKVRAKLDAANEELETLRAAAAPKDARIKELEAKAAKLDDVSAKYDALTASSEQMKADYEGKIAGLKRDALVEGKLRDAGAKNIKAVWALLDMTQDNWDEQIAALKTSEDSAFMFKGGSVDPIPSPSGTKPAPAAAPQPKQANWHDAIEAAINKQKGVVK